MNSDRLEKVKQSYDAWWRGENDEPVLYIIYPEEPVDYESVAPDWVHPDIVNGWSNWKQEFVFGQAVLKVQETGDWSYVDQALDVLEHYADCTGHAAQGFPFLFPTVGASMMQALVVGHAEFRGTTIWLELPEPMDWADILALEENTRSEVCEVVMEALRRACERLQDRYVFAYPELGGRLDVLATLRGTQNLLFDLIDCPENVQQALDTLEALWWKFHGEFDSIIAPGNHGCYTIAMRMMSPQPMECGTCDFSAMISPDMFEQFVMPFLRRQADHFEGRIIWHLDGPGEIPHLDHLLPFEGVHAIQWVSGAGNPHGMDPAHDDLYTRMLDAGKKIMTGGPARPEVLREFFARFPKEAFCMNFTVGSREEAEALIRVAEE